MAKNTLNYSQIMELPDLEICQIAEEHLSVESNYEVEEILVNFESELDEDSRELIVEYILECQNKMPH